MQKLQPKQSTFTLLKYFSIKFYDSCNALGQDWFALPKKERQQILIRQLQKVKTVLSDGLDIGTIVECTVPVYLVKTERHGLCFYYPKKKMLYRVDDFI